MPRIFPTGLAEALKHGTLETHSTLELTLPDSATGARTLYFATAPVTVGGVKHSAQLRDTSAMKQSLTRAADRVTVDLQNVDTVLGIELINASESFYGARVRFGRYWRDIGSEAIFHKYLLTGAVVGVDVNENTARLALVSDAYAALNVGAAQPVVRNCRWEVIGGYKGPQCGSTSDFLTCNYLLDHADGCSARHSGTNNRARFGGFAYIKSQASVAGAVGLAVPAVNQLVKDDSATYQQRTSIQFLGAPISDDSVNDRTVVNLAGAGREYAIHVITDYSAPSDGSTDATTEVAAAISAANTTGRSLYFPAGTYLVDEAVFTNLNSLSIFGDGPNRSILKSGDSTKAVLNIDAAAAASHTITIENLSIEGAATGSNNHGIYVHGSSGLFNLTLRNVHVRDCGGKGVYITNDCFTQLLEGVDVSDCGDHAIDVVSGNTTTLSRCYVHNVATNKAAYRLRYGDYTLIGCNGIDSGTTADWGVFGQNTGDDGVETYTRATLIGCNLEDFTNRGIRFKTGSFANFFSTAILAPASGTVKALEYEFVGTSATGIFDAASSINTKGASWSSGYAVHSSGAPFLQLGHTDTTSYYDTNVGGATTLPALTANLVAGSTNYALLLSRAKITALEASALVSDLTGSTSFTGDAARILLQAGSNSRPTLASTDTNGTGIYFPSSGANLAATVSGTQRLLLGTNHTFTGNVGINTAGSSSYALEVASGAARFTGVLGASDPVLELRSATNPHLLVSDTANTITARLGTLAGAPDRAFVGTMTNHPFGLYQNGSECWTINTSGHLVPGSATTYNVGSASLPVNDLYLAGTFFLAPRSDPGSPTNSDFWRSSTRNAISARISGQTEDLSATMWRSSAQSSFDTTSAATSVIADTGVGTKTIAADRLVAGTQIRITAGGLFGTKASSAGTLTMRVRTGGTTMVTAVFTLPDGLVDQAWDLEAFGALNTTGSSGVIYWRLVWLITDSSGVVYMPNVVTNSTTINTTVSRALDVTAQFSASDADNYFQTDSATIEVLA